MRFKDSVQIPDFISRDLCNWMLEGDVSIQYQAFKYLMGEERKDLKKRILKEGLGKAFMDARNDSGTWGQKYYQPKWISTHYTLLDIRNLEPEVIPEISGIIEHIIETEKGPDGGILPIGHNRVSDMCINGMFLNFASYFQAKEEGLKSIVDCVISQWMPDGGFNCRLNRSGARHSSVHTTISVLEGITSYLKEGYRYRSGELELCRNRSVEFLLMHKLYRSDHTGAIISKEFLRLRYPYRWKYDVLRAMDYFALANISWDDRMEDALNHLISKMNKDGSLNVHAHHPGKVHFGMEKAGKPSRWNTLRMQRILKHFNIVC